MENKPAPYILYGPPGTGKTQTLVAAIEQIVRSTDKNVLVCANSNAACDEIAERLIDHLTEDELFRFYTKKYKKRNLSSPMEPYSNWFRGEFHQPSLEFLLEFRVIICTLCTASYLTRINVRDHVNHFSYVIIDECASTHETMALAAIAGKTIFHHIFVFIFRVFFFLYFANPFNRQVFAPTFMEFRVASC